MSRPTCPTPDKRRFRDRIGAALFAARDAGPRRRNGSETHEGRDRPNEPYRCPCGAWHVRTVGPKAARHGR